LAVVVVRAAAVEVIATEVADAEEIGEIGEEEEVEIELRTSNENCDYFNE
jgi:hypothetical protein